MFESLDDHENGVIAAYADIERLPLHPHLLIQSHAGLGRCHARLGRTDAAETSFKVAIAEAKRCRLHFLEMLAHCDYIEHVLDPAGRREEELPALGECLTKMASKPEEFSFLLTQGIDAQVAVETFLATQ